MKAGIAAPPPNRPASSQAQDRQGLLIDLLICAVPVIATVLLLVLAL
ncbi:hypothetical protein ACLBWX_05505 [Methylobacterium sp. M6A4_1b]